MALDFFFASSNHHKARELTEFFDSQVLVIRPPPENIEVEETGQSFTQNAFLKAVSYYQKFKMPVMADDSGLTVAALPEELGIYSARFGGEGLNDRERAELLLQKLEGKVGKEREAFFTCVLCFYLCPEEIFYFEGRLKGEIACDYIGEHGFGYDPVFIPKGDLRETLGMRPEWKKKHSHRFRACQLAEQFFSNY